MKARTKGIYTNHLTILIDGSFAGTMDYDHKKIYLNSEYKNIDLNELFVALAEDDGGDIEEMANYYATFDIEFEEEEED